MLERLKKLRSGNRYYVANYKKDQDSKLQLKNGNWLLRFFYSSNFFFAAKECIKNNA